MTGMITLAEIARLHTMLDVACRRCERRGRLSVARLIAEHGPGEAHGLFRVIAADCPKMQNQIAHPGDFYNRCGVHFPGLTGRERV